MIIDRYCSVTDRYFWIILLGILFLKTFACSHNKKMPVYQINKVVNGTFHQGDSRFGSTAGRQCACNSLFSIFWSSIRSISRWTSHDLDKILTEGDKIYKSLHTNNYLCVDDLPSTIELDGLTSNVILVDLYDCEATLVQDFPFLRALNGFTRHDTNSTQCLMIIEEFTIAIFRVEGSIDSLCF